MKKIIIDARRHINSGIGRVSQWLVAYINEQLFDDIEIWYLTTKKSLQDYDFKTEKIILSDTNPFSNQDTYQIPCLLMDNNFDLYLNPQMNTSPFHIIPTINIIHDFWALTNVEWLPTVNDIRSRFSVSNMITIQKMACWLTEEKAKTYLTKFGFEKWKNCLLYNNIISRYAWSQYTAIAVFASQICLVSEHMEDMFFKLFKRRSGVTVIPNGLKKEWGEIKRTKGKYFLNLSKLEKRKNIHGLLDAYQIYTNKIKSPYSLILAGDPGYEHYAETVIKRINELNKSGLNINFFPSVNDNVISKLFEEAVALLFPSYFEGYGLPPLEAMMAGVPVVASKTGIMAEKVFGKYATLLKKNTPNELAEIMKKLTENLTPYEYLAKAARQNIRETLDNSEIQKQWANLINKTLES